MKNFLEKLKSYSAKKASDHESKTIEEWFAYNDGLNSFSELSETQKRQIGQEMKLSIFKKVRKYHRIIYFRMAASVLLVIGLIFILLEQTGDDQVQYVEAMTSSDQTKKVMLVDGTIVWLKPFSKLTYKTASNIELTRQVELDGEALFEVAKVKENLSLKQKLIGQKPKNLPFGISAGSINLEVLGTSFHVRNRDTIAEVLVLTGQVNVYTNDDEIWEMRPGDKSQFLLDNDLQVKSVEQLPLLLNTQKPEEVYTHVEVMDLMKGTEYNLNFKNASLKDITDQLGRKFDIEITIPEEIYNCRMTINLIDISLENAIDILTRTLEADVRHEKGIIHLNNVICKE